MPITPEQLVAELRTSSQYCRPIVEGPAVKNEVKQPLRRMLQLADDVANLLAEGLAKQAAKKLTKP